MKRKVINVTEKVKTDELSKKIEVLARPSVGPIPKQVNAILVFGSPQLEVPQKVVDLLLENPGLRSAPIIISGKGKVFEPLTEAEKFGAAIEELTKEAGIQHGEIILDKDATRTSENAENIKRIMNEKNIPTDNLLYVNFEVLSFNGKSSLEQLGISDVYTVPARIAPEEGESRGDVLKRIEDWINYHYYKNKDKFMVKSPAGGEYRLLSKDEITGEIAEEVRLFRGFVEAWTGPIQPNEFLYMNGYAVEISELDEYYKYKQIQAQRALGQADK